MSDLDLFRVFLTQIQAAGKVGYEEWARDNCGKATGGTPQNPKPGTEVAAWYHFRDRVLGGGQPLVPAMGTKFGRALVAAGEMAIESADPEPEPPPAVGIAPGVSFGGIGYTDDSAKRGRMMDDVQTVGGKTLRLQWWRQQQCYDAVQQALGKGLKVINTCMPDYSQTVVDRSKAKAYGTEWANLLGGLVKDVAFWNEPDLTNTWTPELWADACVGFQEGVQASQHPDVRIWVGELWTWKMNSGSTSEGAAEWWRRAYVRWKALGLNGMPGHGCSGHMYGDTGWQDVRNAIFGYFGSDLNGGGQLNVRTLMNQNGDADKPIIATECGNNNATGQVNAVNSMFDLYQAKKLSGLTVYSMWDDAAGTFGLRPGDGLPQRPAYGVYQTRSAGVTLPSMLTEVPSYAGGQHRPRPASFEARHA